MDSILDRIRVLEKKIEEGAFSLNEEQLAALGSQRNNESVPEEEAKIDREAILQKELEPAEYEDMKMIMESIDRIRHEQELRNKVGAGTMSLLDEASINVGHDHKSIVLTFPGTAKGKMAYTQFSKEEHRQVLQDTIGELTGKSVEITCQIKESIEETDVSNINLSKVNFDIKMTD